MADSAEVKYDAEFFREILESAIQNNSIEPYVALRYLDSLISPFTGSQERFSQHPDTITIINTILDMAGLDSNHDGIIEQSTELRQFSIDLKAIVLGAAPYGYVSPPQANSAKLSPLEEEAINMAEYLTQKFPASTLELWNTLDTNLDKVAAFVTKPNLLEDVAAEEIALLASELGLFIKGIHTKQESLSILGNSK